MFVELFCIFLRDGLALSSAAGVTCPSRVDGATLLLCVAARSLAGQFFLLVQHARERDVPRTARRLGDRQPIVNRTESVARGANYAGKKGSRRKRPHHQRTPTSHLLCAQVHASDIQDRDGAVGRPASIRYLFPGWRPWS